jgi:hypothetical protein
LAIPPRALTPTPIEAIGATSGTRIDINMGEHPLTKQSEAYLAKVGFGNSCNLPKRKYLKGLVLYVE